MSGHTPGNWHAHDGNAVLTDGEGGPFLIAKLSAWMPREEQAANARLIAAAPDSHEANVKFIEAIECLYNVTAGWTGDRIYDELPSSGLALAYFAARDAIAKATGGAA